jgi:2,3-bisphosphoglycerate-independent phosphoglycerate mutase
MLNTFFQKLFAGNGKTVEDSPNAAIAPDPSIKPVFLIIIDGWGVAPLSSGNGIAQARIPNLEKLFASYPHTELIASGESVGLPANEVGSTEVGHLTIGTGRVILQGLKRVNKAIEDGDFFQNDAFFKAIQHVKQHNSKLHIIGAISTGKVHASIEHFYGLLQVCQNAGLHNVYVHAFTDGRDSPPREALTVLGEVDKRLSALNFGGIATVTGRYYAMDRDRRWERIDRAYQAMVEGKGKEFSSYAEAIQKAYDSGLTDELIEPSVIMRDGKPIATIDDNDAVIFFNFRIGRPRELAMAMTIPDFEKVDITKFGYMEAQAKDGHPIYESTFVRHKIPQGLFFVTMLNYQENIPVSAVAFGIDQIKNPFSEVLSKANLRQLHMAESEKERFVSYYFDGYRETTFPGEDVLIIPSPHVRTYDKKPAMSTFSLVASFKKNLALDRYHFFVMNIAAPDMVAHTGNINATIKACETTDIAVGDMVRAVLEKDGTVFLTADHGHAEKLLEYDSTSFFFTSSEGNMSTEHSNNPVPFMIINNALTGTQPKMVLGTLSDVAATILTYMHLEVPLEMSGRSLLPSA